MLIDLYNHACNRWMYVNILFEHYQHWMRSCLLLCLIASPLLAPFDLGKGFLSKRLTLHRIGRPKVLILFLGH